MNSTKSKVEKKVRNLQPLTGNVATLRNMMNKAIEWGYLSKNLLDGVKQLKEDNYRMWVLTPEEEAKLWRECDKRKQKKQYVKDLVLFALSTGMRLEEIQKKRDSLIMFDIVT